VESLSLEDVQHLAKRDFPWKAQHCQEAGISLTGHGAVLFQCQLF